MKRLISCVWVRERGRERERERERESMRDIQRYRDTHRQWLCFGISAINTMGPSIASNVISNDIDWTLQWRHNEHDGVSHREPHECFVNRLFKRRSKKITFFVTDFCGGNSSVTFPAQRASNAENVSIDIIIMLIGGEWRIYASVSYAIIFPLTDCCLFGAKSVP